MLWELLSAFVLAATPWIELLLVVPAGLAWGLPPVPLAIVVIAGNVSSLVPVIWLHERYRRWRYARARKRVAERRGQPRPDRPRTRRGARAQRLWNRYGLPGLALLAPLVTGVHLAAAIALLAGANRKLVLLWLIGSIILWTIGMTIVSMLGIEGIRMLGN